MTPDIAPRNQTTPRQWEDIEPQSIERADSLNGFSLALGLELITRRPQARHHESWPRFEVELRVLSSMY
ncbi:hypothetical protein TNCV_789191 [Trichonephila clavipes]|nr:hypothetical protein TNCV_789191 [Trichonephila clavipes]